VATQYKTRLTILEDAEIEELYGRPRFTHDERVHYFALTAQERAVADGHYSLTSRVLFILQAGYFKAKAQFFSFEIDEVANDVKHVLQEHYPQFHDVPLKSAVFKQTRHTQQRKLLELYDYRACVGAARAALVAKADQVVRISAKPIFVFQALVQYLATHRVVAPGYSFLQDVVGRALGKERGRLTSLLDDRLDETTRKMLDRLYLERDAGYAVTPLKQDPKDFSRRELRREMARGRLLEPLYRTATALLPELGISNDSIAHYAALVDYYTVQKLQQLPPGMARLYLLCFVLQRYQEINDNLINALIYQVRRVLAAAKVGLQERLLSDRREGSENVQHIGQILDLFLDDSIGDSVSFGEIKRRAFAILERDQIRRAAEFIGAHSIDVPALEWEFVANLAPMFKPYLRPLLRHLPLAGHR